MKQNSLFKYTWPILVELLLQLLVSNVDKIMVNGMSDTAVSSISNATTVLDVLIIAFSVISLAITILASQFRGQNDDTKISQVYSLGIIVTCFIALCVAIFVFINAEFIFNIISIPQECMRDSVVYIRIIALGLVFQGIYTAYVAMFRSQGFMKEGMFVSIVMNITNIVGNYLLIGGYGFIPALNVAGAAISSVMSRILGLILLVLIFNHKSKVSINFKLLNPWPSKLFKQMLYVGLPSGLEAISYSVSQTVILSFVNMMGNVVIKLRSFANMFQMCAYMYGSAVSQAAQIIVGFLIGKKDYDGVNHEVNKTLFLSVLISALVTFVLYLFSDQIFGLFISDVAMLKVAKKLMLIEIFLESARAVNMTLVRCLQAVNDTIYPTVIGVIFMWGCATLLSYVLGIVFNMGLVGVWIAMCLDESFRAIIFLIRFKRNKWRNIVI